MIKVKFSDNPKLVKFDADSVDPFYNFAYKLLKDGKIVAYLSRCDVVYILVIQN